MPIIKSAKKRVRTANKAAVRNSKTKRSLRTAFKAFGKTPSADSHAAAQSNVDKAVKKGLIHKNKAARMKKRLAAQAKAAGAKPVAAKKTATKAAPAKKAPAKKPAAKKAPAKKPAAKK
jgi:ribosomal protein S20